ncbi:MAG TPA: DinB family protein [Candidatus Sulfomarinibacteraceae bacterium]|nr:DinB family protein [Candidatus Sulfomarinibacteraceae bacterium]
MEDEREKLIAQLQQTQAAIDERLRAVAEQQDWQPEPGQWSFRYVAAHLAAVEKDCMWERLQRIASGSEPHFEYYENTGWDFSQQELTASLETWRRRREESLAFVRALLPEALSLEGTHAAFGTITVQDVMRIILEHDQEHLAELDEALEAFAGDTRRE